MDRNHELVQIQGGVVVLVTERPNLCCSSIVELSNLSKLYAGIICIMILQHLTDTKKPTQKRDAAPNFQAGIIALKTKIRVLLTQSPRSIYNTRAARRDLLQRRGAKLALHEQVATGLGLHEAGASRILLLEEARVFA